LLFRHHIQRRGRFEDAGSVSDGLSAKEPSQRPDLHGMPWNVDLRHPGNSVLLVYLNDLPLDQIVGPPFLDHSEPNQVGGMLADLTQVVF